MGRALPERAAEELGAGFGVDFSAVRVHADREAAVISRQLQAQAFSYGSDLYFSERAYNPDSASGRRLLAHELAHVVQSSTSAPTHQGPMVGRADDEAERSADHLAAAALRRSRGETGSGQVLATPRAQDIRRMKILGLGKEEYTPGDMPRFKQDFALAKAEAVEAAGGNVEKVMLRLAMVDSENDFGLLFDVLAAAPDIEYANLDEFLSSLQKMRSEWGGQKIFYEKALAAAPKPIKGNAKAKKVVGKQKDAQTTGPMYAELPNVKFQESRTVRLYSARERAQIKDLYAWAIKNGVPTEGFDGFEVEPGKPAPRAPFKGHFGDRSHTVKYARQKKGGGLICIVLTEQASESLRKTKNEPGKVATDGGEGYEVGGFGFKLESTFVSVAIGESRETWDFLKGKIAKIILEQTATSESTTGPDEADDAGLVPDEDAIISFSTWEEASYQRLEAGTLIRITAHQYDISDRIFQVVRTYEPSLMEYPDINGFVKWLK